jgi:hypothetical protein
MLSQENSGTGEAAQDTLDELILARLIPAILSLMLWDNDIVLLSLLDNAIESLRGEGDTNTSLSHGLDVSCKRDVTSIFTTPF